MAGSVKNLDVEALIDRKLLRFMAKGHAYSWIAMQEAIADAALPEALVSNVRTGLIVGAGGTSTESMLESTIYGDKNHEQWYCCLFGNRSQN